MTAEAPVLEVIVFAGSNAVARAEAGDVESLVFAGQTLHDEALPSCQQVAKLEVGFYCDGRLVRMVEGRP